MPKLLPLAWLWNIVVKCSSLSFVLGCNITLENKTSGWILSPQYPGYYTNNASCQWHLTVPPGHVIRLEFLYFDLEFRWHPWYRCSDFVEIHDGLSRSNCTYCVLPTTITSSGREMLIIFKSNGWVIRGGFKAKYRAIPGMSWRYMINHRDD